MQLFQQIVSRAAIKLTCFSAFCFVLFPSLFVHFNLFSLIRTGCIPVTPAHWSFILQPVWRIATRVTCLFSLLRHTLLMSLLSINIYVPYDHLVLERRVRVFCLSSTVILSVTNVCVVKFLTLMITVTELNCGAIIFQVKGLK